MIPTKYSNVVSKDLDQRAHVLVLNAIGPYSWLVYLGWFLLHELVNPITLVAPYG